jgi:hypothetical protein
MIDFFQTVLYPFLGTSYMHQIISDPPEFHPRGFSFPITNGSFRSEMVVSDKKLRMFWTANPKLPNGVIRQGHSGRWNYSTVRNYFFYTGIKPPQPLLLQDPKIPLSAPQLIYVRYANGSDIDNHVLRYTLNGGEPNASSSVVPSKGSIMITKSSRLRIKTFTKINDLITGVPNESSEIMADYVFVDTQSKPPMLEEREIDYNGNNLIVRVNVPEKYKLGENAMLWYNVNQQHDPLQMDTANSFMSSGQIKLRKPGIYQVKVRYYFLKNAGIGISANGPQLWIPGKVTTKTFTVN